HWAESAPVMAGIALIGVAEPSFRLRPSGVPAAENFEEMKNRLRSDGNIMADAIMLVEVLAALRGFRRKRLPCLTA
ncbi:TPA: hypothetical protein I7721_22830, partial [Vibrio vulnificus]|nr:hypothetical protein [Vibrio vulnificus]